MELLTNSRLRTWRTCKRLHHLMFVEGWRTRRQAEALRIGTLVHQGLEAWFCSIKEDPTREADALGRALEAVFGKAYDDFEQAKIDEMLLGYHERWWPEQDGLEIVAVEHQFVAQHLNPDTLAPSRTWEIAGKIDVIVRKDGKLLKVEHKTVGDEINDPTSGYWIKLAMDAQVSIYYLGAESLGYEVEGCLYDALKKPGLRPYKATPSEKRKYKKRTKEQIAGGMPADHPDLLYANLRANDETPSEYGARIREEIAKDPNRYYQRRDVVRTASQLQEWMRDAWAEARSMHEAMKAGTRGRDFVPRNPDACHRFGECAFWDVCAHGLDPERHPDRWERLENVHPELEFEPVEQEE